MQLKESKARGLKWILVEFQIKTLKDKTMSTSRLITVHYLPLFK
jgi:hypothetical protein